LGTVPELCPLVPLKNFSKIIDKTRDQGIALKMGFHDKSFQNLIRRI
jgi:hypothetical protein